MKRSSSLSARDDSRSTKSKRTKTVTPKLTYLKRSPRVELKTVYDNIGPFTTVANPAVWNVYGTIDAGDAFNQRGGKLVQHISQDVIMRFDLGPAYDSTTFRVIHGVWNNADDAVVPSDVLATGLIAGVDQWIAPYNATTTRRYHIIADELFTINNTGHRTGSASPCAGQLMVKRNYKYKRMQEYQGTAAAQVVNWVYFYMVCSTTGAGTAEVSHACHFIDM